MKNLWIYDIFKETLHMSMTAGIIICLILGIRLLLRQAPKIFSYLLWSVVLFRLLCPVAAPSPFSVLRFFDAPVTGSAPAAPTPGSGVKNPFENQNDTAMPQDTFDAVSPAMQEKDGPAAPGSSVAETSASAAKVSPAIFYGCLIWLIGIFTITAYGIVSILMLLRKISCPILIKDNIYLSDHIDTPFTMGILFPKIYLPTGLLDSEKDFIILHEQTHIRRGDHIIKLLAFFALTVHWFNPLVWVFFFAIEKDMEMSCDETVLKKTTKDIRADYSRSLLCLASGKKILNKTPLAFGEGNTKSRIKNIMQYKKPAVFIVCASILLVAVCLLCLGTDPLADTAAVTENPSMAEAALETDLLEKAAIRWAKAFCARDWEKIAAMSTDETKETLKSAGLLEETGQAVTFGVSSPWPWNLDYADYEILGTADNTAEILYYARTSEPHICVWKETLKLTQLEDKSIRVMEENLVYYDKIRSFQEFITAYPHGISDTPMDYRQDGMAESLNANALLSSSWIYQTLSDPQTAAIHLLNLDEDAVSANIIEEKADDSVLVNLHFTDGAFTVKMICLFAKDDLGGIWIPQDNEDEETSEDIVPADPPKSVPAYSYSPKQEILMGQHGAEFDEEFYGLYTEETVYSVTADVTHDKIPDRLDVIAADNNESPHTDPVERLDGIGLGYVKVYPGTTDGGFENNPCFITPQLSSTHVSNGQTCLVKKDGMDYLLTSNMYEIMGMAGYYYAVFYLDPDDYSAVCVDEQSVSFSISEGEDGADLPRKERIPDFIEHLEQWTGDSILFISCDAFGEPYVWLSEGDTAYTASDYYDTVWER